jgi:holo-[acyl-carrier protein] synthase
MVHGRLGCVIVGVGIDVVDVARLEAALIRTPALAQRLFTEGERGLSLQSLAARFAAKEAVAKALGGPRGLRWTDAEVVRGAGGRPLLRVHGTVADAASRLGVRHWHLSLSHDAGVATAVVIAEGDPEGTAPESGVSKELLADGQGG